MFAVAFRWRAGRIKGNAEMAGGKAVVWGVRFLALIGVTAMLAACTPTGDEQNGIVDPVQERGPYAPVLG
jgi:hypothetical protein